MAEDALRLREELTKIKKDIEISKHVKEVMDRRIEELHAEELRYLGEIPLYKKQAEDSKQNYLKLESQNLPLKQELQKMVNELAKVRALVVEEEKALREAREAGHNLEKDFATKNFNILKREEFVKFRELSSNEREKNHASRELFHKKVESDLDNREVKINNRQKELEQSHKDLSLSMEFHQKNVSKHLEDLKSFSEQRKFHEEDKQLLKDKLSKANKLVSDHIEIKQQLLLQADKSSQEIKKAENKQVMLDKALAELEHTENILRIKDLKIRKMAHDAGLQKELKELEASLK